MGRRKPHTPRIEWRNGLPLADMRPWGGQRYTKVYSPRSGRLATTASEAARWSLHLVRQQEKAPVAGSVAALVDAYLAERARGPRTTYDNYANVLGRLAAFAASRSLEATDWHAFVQELLAEGYAPATVRSYLTLLRTFCKQHGVVLPEVWMPKESAPLPATLSPEEVMERIARLPQPLEAAVAVCFGTGARIGEALALRASDFDRARCIVRIERQITPYGEMTAPKGKKARKAVVLDFLWEHLPQRGFCVGGGERPISQSIIKKRAIKEGMPGGWHVYRHSYARHLLQHGVPMHALQRLLGHASINITERYYGHFADDDAIASAQKALAIGLR